MGNWWGSVRNSIATNPLLILILRKRLYFITQFPKHHKHNSFQNITNYSQLKTFYYWQTQIWEIKLMSLVMMCVHLPPISRSWVIGITRNSNSFLLFQRGREWIISRKGFHWRDSKSFKHLIWIFTSSFHVTVIKESWKIFGLPFHKYLIYVYVLLYYQSWKW